MLRYRHLASALGALLWIAPIAAHAEPPELEDQCGDWPAPSWDRLANHRPAGRQTTTRSLSLPDAVVVEEAPTDFPEYASRCLVRRSDGVRRHVDYCRLAFAGDLNADGRTDFGFDIIDFPGCTATRTLMSTEAGWTLIFADGKPETACVDACLPMPVSTPDPATP